MFPEIDATWIREAREMGVILEPGMSVWVTALDPMRNPFVWLRMRVVRVREDVSVDVADDDPPGENEGPDELTNLSRESNGRYWSDTMDEVELIPNMDDRMTILLVIAQLSEIDPDAADHLFHPRELPSMLGPNHHGVSSLGEYMADAHGFTPRWRRAP